MSRFHYAGKCYVRPVGRGVVLIDSENAPQLEDILNDLGYGDIVVTFIPADPKRQDEYEKAHKAAVAPERGTDT